MASYRYFTYPATSGEHRRPVWRSDENGRVEMRTVAGWHQVTIETLEDLVGPDEEDLAKGYLVEIEEVELANS